MLQILRKHSKHWLIFVIVGAIVVVFIFWGMGGMDPPNPASWPGSMTSPSR
jgi:hypothetical protein